MWGLSVTHTAEQSLKRPKLDLTVIHKLFKIIKFWDFGLFSLVKVLG